MHEGTLLHGLKIFLVYLTFSYFVLTITDTPNPYPRFVSYFFQLKKIFFFTITVNPNPYPRFVAFFFISYFLFLFYYH